MKAEYIRAKGFEPIQQEQMVLDYVRKHGRSAVPRPLNYVN